MAKRKRTKGLTTINVFLLLSITVYYLEVSTPGLFQQHILSTCRKHFPVLSSCTTYHRVLTRFTRRVPLVEQEQPIIPEHRSSPPVFKRVRVTRSLALCVCFIDRCLFFFFWSLCCLFFFNIRILVISLVSSSSSLINKDYTMYVNLRCLLSRYILGAFLVNRCIELLLQMNSHRFQEISN